MRQTEGLLNMEIAAFVFSILSFCISVVALFLNIRKKHQVATLNLRQDYEKIYDYCCLLSEDSSEGISARNKIHARKSKVKELLLFKCLYGKEIVDEFEKISDYTSIDYNELLLKMQKKYVKEIESANSKF